MRKKPETLWQVAWHWSIGFGVGAAVGIVALSIATTVPALQQTKLVGRVWGTQPLADALGAEIQRVADRTGKQPFVVTDRYGESSLLAFYLPGNPTVYCAQHHMGYRATQYDYFADTDLSDPSLVGRPAIALRSGEHVWRRVFDFGKIDKLDLPDSALRAQRWGGKDYDYLVLHDYRGPNTTDQKR